MNALETNLSVPRRDEVSPNNQAIFDDLKSKIGFVPNVYAYLAKNETALSDYLNLQNRKSTLRAKEKEIVNLITSQLNNCLYCQSAHTAIAKMNGFSEEEILEIRALNITFNEKFAALAQLTAEVVNNKGNVNPETRDLFFAAGYSEANLIDVVMLVADKIVSNYLYAIVQFDIDFPHAKEI